MAKIAPKGKKVTGTKKKDKITWVSTKPWKKALTVKAGAGNDVINFKKSKYKNTIYGGAGNDKITGGKKNDKIYGGKGNDTIQAGKGNNTLYFSKGDGKDTVLKGGGTDTLVFKTEKSLSGLKVAYSGNNAIITYNGGSVTLKDYKLGGHSAKYVQVGSSKKAIADYFKPVGPTYNIINGGSNHNIVGTDKNDSITGSSQDDTITGGKGDDILVGGAGANTYIYNNGDGVDTIISTSSGDVLHFTDYSSVSFEKATNSNDVNVFDPDGNKVVVLKDFLNYENLTDLRIKLSDGSGKSIFTYLDGNYGISYSDGHTYAAIPYTEGDDILIGGIEDEYVNSPFNTLIGGKGNDKFYIFSEGNKGQSMVRLSIGDGNDVLYATEKRDNIYLNFYNSTFAEVSARTAWHKNGNDLVINYGTSDSLTVKGYFHDDGSVMNNFRLGGSDGTYDMADYINLNVVVNGTDGNDTSLSGTDADESIFGLGGDDTITGGKGNDLLFGGEGNNTFIFNKGDGVDKIIFIYGSENIIKFNDVGIMDLDFDIVDGLNAIKYGENDVVKLKDGAPVKIIDKNGDVYHYIADTRDVHVRWNNVYLGGSWGESYTLTEEDNKLLIVGNKNGQDSVVIEDSDSFVNAIIWGRGGNASYQDYLSDYGSAKTIIVVKKQDSYTTVTQRELTDILYFKDTTLDDIKLSLMPINPENLSSFGNYNFCLAYNSGNGSVIFSAGSSHSTHGFYNVTLKDYTGDTIALYDKLNYQKYYRYGSYNTAYEHTIAGDTTVVGTAGDDFFVGQLDNSEYKLTVSGEGGNDTIWGFHTVYGYKAGQKNTTAGDSVKFYAAESCESTMYAQSETNEIVGNSSYNNTYYAYIDQKTSIWEKASDTYSIGDVLNFTDTSVDDKDGQLFDSSSNKQIHVVFNVTNDYDRTADNALFAFGEISFVDNDNLALWKAGSNYKGVTLTNNSIETINTTDGYHLTNANIADLAQSVATWLTSGGRTYGSVNDVLASNNETDITALIAQFDNANWTNAG